MKYYLAYIRTIGKDNGYYQLVIANSKEEAVQKVQNLVGEYKLVDITETIE